LETTGLYAGRHGICQIGAWVTGESEDHFKGYFVQDCDPNYAALNNNGLHVWEPVKHEESAFEVNGFTESRISEAPDLYDVLREFNDFVTKQSEGTDLVFVCQNTPFDIGLMQDAYLEAGLDTKIFRRTLDTISFGFMVYGECLSQAKLSAKLGMVNGGAHDALADAVTCSKIFFRLRKMLKVSV
jgi:DNA polymerase III epsilon subunit-like protein